MNGITMLICWLSIPAVSKDLNRKLYTGIQRVEDYAKTVDNGGSL